MRISLSIGQEGLADVSPSGLVDRAVEAERQGFPGAWTVHFSRGLDALTALGVAGTRTSTIDLGVGVVPTYPRHPLALAQQAATAQAFCGGRLTLGVGVSHRPVIEGLHGIPYASPAEHMREYLSVLVPLLRTGEVTYQGEHYRVDGGFTVSQSSPVSVVVGALGPRMVDAAGELADGVVTWLAGPRSLSELTVPRLLAAASGRPTRVVAAIPVALCSDVPAAREVANETFGRYGGLENYQRLFDREGVRTVGELVVVGDESQVRAGLAQFADVGVTEVWAVPFDVGSGVGDTVSLLADLARS